MEPDEIVAVCGHPGFGGTTIARVIAGLLSPTSGAILCGGRDITKLSPARRPVGLVPAGGALLPQLVCRDNITYGLRLRQAPNVDVRERLEMLTRRFDLQPLLDQRPHELWADQRMRVAFARALARPKVDVLVVDATAGAEGVTEVRDLIVRGAGAEPMAALLCTSDPAVIDQAHRVAVIRDGRVRFSGTPDALRREPPDLDVARLVHPDRTPVLTAVAGDGELTFPDLRSSEGPVRVSCRHGVAAGVTVDVLLTPRSVRLVAPGQGTLPAKIVDALPAGRWVDALIAVAGQPEPWRARLDEGWPRVGDAVGVRFDGAHMVAFARTAAEPSARVNV